ncbi:ubiquinol-cytochrome c reductase cytochrome b subunit [Angustibacter aerolatus]
MSAGCFAVLLLTGVVLMVWYEPSSATVRYRGSYLPLRDVEVSRAFNSVLHLSLEVRGGLLVRQAHHWAALLLPATLTLKLLTKYFTGTFRRPRRLRWVLLLGCLLLALTAGWSGYALPDDALSGTGLRIVEGVVLGIPLVGTRLAWLGFGGELPGDVVPRLHVVHLAVSALLLVPAALWWRVARPRPVALVRAAGLALVTAGVVVVMAATATVSPVWGYGPASTSDAFADSQPDWYTAFLDGALRLCPGWEVEWLGRTWTLAVLLPLLLVGLAVTAVAAAPLLVSRLTGDHAEHLRPHRPRDAPTRTAVGAAGLTGYLVLWSAAGADLMATHFGLALEDVVRTLRVLLLVAPPAAFAVTRSAARVLREQDADLLAHGVETGRLVRLPDGGFVEIHQPVDPATRRRLTVQSSGTTQVPARSTPSGSSLRPATSTSARRPAASTPRS